MLSGHAWAYQETSVTGKSIARLFKSRSSNHIIPPSLALFDLQGIFSLVTMHSVVVLAQ